MRSLVTTLFGVVLWLAPGARPALAQSASSASFRAELALRYGPIHHQDVHVRGASALGGAADYITALDFDGDYDSSNNWDNAGNPRFPLAAHAYFSVVETASHWFIIYQFFHPRDWSSTFFETEHENDAEGVMLAVHRDGSRYGSLRAAVTVVHADFYSFVPTSSPWSDGREDVDGVLRLQDFQGAPHPITAQQAETHALKAWPYYSIKSEGVVYYPSLTIAEAPSGPNDRSVFYRLRDVLEPGGLWQRRHDARIFTSFGTFAGDGAGGCGKGAFLCRENAAHAPWAWNDHDDRSPRGAMTSDPAGLARSYFRAPEPVSARYLFNPFR
jgi:hypothetical protein